eukprot:15461700-Alexandrium_andersonii.AAC.1
MELPASVRCIRLCALGALQAGLGLYSGVRRARSQKKMCIGSRLVGVDSGRCRSSPYTGVPSTPWGRRWAKRPSFPT